MKKLYIPKGETRHFESVESEHIIVKGCLKVDGAIKARHISGDGILEAGVISAKTVTAMDIEAAIITVEKLAAERVCAVEVHASESAVVSCRLEAQLVEAGKLTVADSEIGELRADDVVNLPAKKRGLVGTLLASWLRGLWASLFCRAPKESKAKADAMDADWTPQTAEEAVPTGPAILSTTEKNMANADFEDDFEFKRLKALYQMTRGQGYYLRLVSMEPPAANPFSPVRPAA